MYPVGTRWPGIRGLDELVTWLGKATELGFTIREHDVFGNDEHVCALSYMGARRTGGRPSRSRSRASSTSAMDGRSSGGCIPTMPQPGR